MSMALTYSYWVSCSLRKSVLAVGLENYWDFKSVAELSCCENFGLVFGLVFTWLRMFFLKLELDDCGFVLFAELLGNGF